MPLVVEDAGRIVSSQEVTLPADGEAASVRIHVTATEPGPRTYNRTHVDGANMLAAALAPHRGIVMWRAFVYDMKPGYDRAGAAYENLQPFDGEFAANVLLQVKNGPIDFQPREPFHGERE